MNVVKKMHVEITEKPVSIEVINKVLAEIELFDKSALSIIQVDDANSCIFIKDYVTGAVLKYRDETQPQKWSYTCKFGEFRCLYLSDLVKLRRGIGTLGLEGSGRTSLPLESMYFANLYLKNSSDKYVSLGGILHVHDNWIVELPRVRCGEVSNKYRKYKSFDSYWDAWEYSRFYIMAIMHDYKFPSWVTAVVLRMENLYSPELPSYNWLNPEERWNETSAPKYLLLGAYCLLFLAVSLVFLTEFVISHFPYMLLGSGVLSWAYVWGAMGLGSPPHFVRKRTFIRRQNVRFPIYKSILYLLPAVVVTAADEIVYFIKSIRSAFSNNEDSRPKH